MNYENDEGLDDIFATLSNPSDNFFDENFSESQYLGVEQQLQLPLHEEPTSNYELEYANYNDSSLSVPMREVQYVSEPPQLSPVQSYPYDMSQDNSLGYNSFEQPVGVINGDYTHPIDDPLQQPVDSYYSDEQPSTSGHQIHASTSSSRHQTPLSRQPPPRNSIPSQSNKPRPIQPKGRDNNRSRTRPPEQPKAPAQQLEVRLDKNTSIRIEEIVAELATLQQQQQSQGIDNSSRITELQNRLMILFNLPEELMQESQPPPPTVAPIANSNRRVMNNTRRIEYNEGPSSPGYQPQFTMMAQGSNQATVYQTEYQTQPVMIQQNSSQPSLVRVQQPIHGQPVVYVSQGGQFIQATQTNNRVTQYVTTNQPQPIQPRPGPVTAKVVVKPAPRMIAPSIAPQSHAYIIPKGQAIPQGTLMKQEPFMVPSQSQQYTIQRPPKQTPVSIAHNAGERRISRQQRLHEYFKKLARNVENPETERPFSDFKDIIERMLGFHTLDEPDLKDEELNNFDSNLLRTTINQSVQVAALKRRVLKAVYKEPATFNPPEEQNLLLYLDFEYEKRKLEEEKAVVSDYNRLEFVQNSPIIPGLRGKKLEKPDQQQAPLKLVNQYEYYQFEEPSTLPLLSPVKSPYLMSPTSSNISFSPQKSPRGQVLHSPRLSRKSMNEEAPPILTRSAEISGPLRVIPKIKAEPVDAGYETIERVPKMLPPSKAPIKPMKSKIKQEVSEPVPSTSSYEPLKALPSKKMFLNRARNEAPPALRSPPALMARPPLRTYNGIDSDGSVSPELGGDMDFIPKSLRQSTETTNDIKSSPLKKLAPLPAPQVKKVETPEPMTKSTIKTEVPWKKEALSTSPNGFSHLRPIKLRIKIAGTIQTIVGEKDEEKETKRRKKEEKKRKREEHEIKREERRRKRALDVKEEYTAIPLGGLKLKFKLNTSRSNTPIVPDGQPSVNGFTTNKTDAPMPKIPKLKIKLGAAPQENKIQIAEPVAPVTLPVQSNILNGPSLFTSQQGDLPAVTFSDQSDGDDDLLRATDETMRSWGMTRFQPTPTVPPYPSHP